MFCRKQFVSNF